MKLINIATKLFFGALIFNIIYTGYFGWNLEPINETEKMLDTITKYAMHVAFILYLIPGVRLYEYNVERHGKIKEHRKKKDNVSWDFTEEPK